MFFSSLNKASLLQGHISSVLVDSAESLGSELHLDVAVQFRNPDTLGLKIWNHEALVYLSDVASDTAFFLRQTRAVNLTTNADF